MDSNILKIEIERLIKGPIKRDYELPPADFDLLEDREFSFREPVKGSITAKLAGPHNVLVEGTIATTAKVECVRCLHELKIPLTVSFQTVFLPTPEDAERFDDPQDDDRLYYKGDMLDPREQMREELMLALPALPSCEHESMRDCPHGRELGDMASAATPAAEEAPEPAPNSWQAQLDRVRRELDS